MKILFPQYNGYTNMYGYITPSTGTLHCLLGNHIMITLENNFDWLHIYNLNSWIIRYYD